MAGSRTLKNRIKSTKNIRQMTRAMEAVSAVKMRRSVGLALASRPYAIAALELLREVKAGTRHEDFTPALSSISADGPTLLLVITSDRGLAGAFNAQVIRAAERFIRGSAFPVDVIAVGKKGRDHFKKIGVLSEHFVGAGDFGAVGETRPIAELIEARFRSHACGRVAIAYTNFLSALKQDVVVKEILPFTEEALEAFIGGIIPERGRYANVPKVMEHRDARPQTVVAEPSAEILLDRLLSDLLAIEIHQAILEANASEHSSRMIAMKNASENAAELAEELTVLYNKARQAQITKELSEITAGKEALHA